MKRGLIHTLIGIVLLPLAAGCASQAKLQEYQDEIMQLREERTQLKKENRELEMQLDDYAIALAEANTQVRDEPGAPSYCTCCAPRTHRRSTRRCSTWRQATSYDFDTASRRVVRSRACGYAP